MVRRKKGRLLLALALAASALFATVLVPRPPLAHARAQNAYNCGTLADNHCYGVVEWNRPASGASADITVQSLTAGDGFVDNEIWLIGNAPSNLICPNGVDPHGRGTCWVETGVTAGPVNNTYCESSCYFWADNRPSAPGTVNNYNEHVLGNTPYQDFNHGVEFKIVQATDGPGRYDVQAFDKNCLLVPDFTAVSVEDQLIPTGVDMGMELAGGNGAYSPRAEFTSSQFQDNTGWHYEIDGGTDISDSNSPPDPRSPISRGWDAVPANDGSHATNYGGDWYTKFP